MASRDELADELVLNEYPGIPRITVRPQAVQTPVADDPRMGGWRGQEDAFQQGIRATPWFSEFKAKHGEEPNLFDPNYDYRAAWSAGARPTVRDPGDNMLHWPSQFKGPEHPNRYVNGVDTITGRPPSAPGSMEGGPQPPWGEPAQAAAGGWGSPEASTGRPSMRLFEPDQTPAPVKPQWQPGMLSLVPLARGLGGVVQGARDSFNAPAPPPPQPRAPVDPTAGPRQMFQQGYRGQPPSQPGLVGGLLGEALQAPQNMFSDINVERHPASTPEQVAQAKRQLVGTATETAMNIAGPGIVTAAARPGASAGVFGGRLAKTHSLEKEQIAQWMESVGRTPQEIWKDTGMVKFADGKWAHEIPDTGAFYKGDIDSRAAQIFDQKYPDRAGSYGTDKFRNNRMRGDIARQEARLQEQIKGPQVLENIIEHPEAFEAYGDRLRKIPVEHDPTMSAQGAYHPPTKEYPLGRITYREENQPGKMARGETFKVLLHEIDHAIAQIEGHARGANPKRPPMQGDPGYKFFEEGMRGAPEVMTEPQYVAAKARQGIKTTPEMYDKYVEDMTQYRMEVRKAARIAAGEKNYLHSAGEGRANAVMERADMTREQLAGIYPPSQFRIPMDRQVVEFNTPFDPAQAQMGNVLNPVPAEMQMSGPSGLMPPKSQRKATGSMNPLDEQDVTWKGKPMSQFNPQDWKEFGDHYGVKNMGPLSKVEKYISPDGYTFELPGGTKGTWTYYDLLYMKANPINPHNLPHELHAEMQKKLGRTMTPHGEVGQDQIWNGLMFGMTSASNPLFPNQLSASRLRLRDPKMLDALADSISWKAGERVSDELRGAKDLEIGRMFNLHEGKSAGSTGLGTRGGVNYTYIAELAQMFRKNPEWFRKKDGEEWIEFVERLATQTKGLSMKTGSFGSVWQDPYMAAISAVDRHMAKEFERRGGLFLNQADQDKFQSKALKNWNKERKLTGDQQIKSWNELTQQRGFEGFMGEELLSYVGAHSKKDFRNVAGEINPSLPKHVQEARKFYEPEKGLQASAAYKRALAENQKAANEQGLNLFMSQWFEWDRIRQRFEPHENMFPGLSQMPAPSKRQLEIPMAAHLETGHRTYDYGPTGRMNPTTKSRRNPSEFGYLGVPLAVGGAAGFGSVVDPSKYQPEAR